MKGSKLNSDTPSSDKIHSDTSSDGSDYTVVTLYSDASSDSLYSVVTRFYSVYSVRYSDLFKLVYSVLLLRLNSSYSVISSLVLLGELNGIRLSIMSWSTLRIVIASSKG